MTEHSEQAPIMISTLPQVTTPQEFFSIERMVIPIAIPLIGAPPHIKDEALTLGGMIYQGEAYLLTTIFGSPENLFLNVQKGVDIKVGSISFTFRFHNELDMLLERELVYDASGYNETTRFDETSQFFIEKCIENNLPTVL